MSETAQTEKRKAWNTLAVKCQATAREAVEYALMEAGALGTETIDEQTLWQSENANATDAWRASSTEQSSIIVKAYFEEWTESARVEQHISEALRLYELDRNLIETVRASETPAQDWLAEWKRNWKPVAVGHKFLITPTWAEVDGSERTTIRIDPGMAFGTGTHETTRLCLELLEDVVPCESFLDVGTGTGILAIALAKLDESARIVACDTDADAVKIARENATLNNVAERVEFRVGTVNGQAETYETVCANLTADVIVPLLPALVAATRRTLILSGILATQEAQVRAALNVRRTKILKDGEWIAIKASI